MALPNSDTFTVSYKVQIDESVTGNQILEGKFAYIKDNATEKYIIPKDIILIGADPSTTAEEQTLAAIEAEAKAKEDSENAAREAAAEAEAPTAEEALAEEAPAEEAPAEEATAAEETPAEEATAAEEVDNSASEEADRQAKEAELERLRAEKAAREAEQAAIDATEVAEEAAPVEEAPNYNDAMLKSKAGLVFRVQVLAGPNQVDPAIVATKLEVSETILLEENEGMFKYVVGEFGSYRPAKTFSNSLRDNNGVEGPFVTSYKDGTRIHVKEALDIAGQ
jgi:flagellar biosynthesis GTPase FlhF